MDNKQWVDMDVLEAYLDGKLDAKAMHQVERISLDDPFFADALEGLSKTKKRQQNLSILQQRLQERIEEKPQKQKIWQLTSQRLSIGAAAAVLFLTASLFLILKDKQQQKLLDKGGKTLEVRVQPKPQSKEEEIKAAKIEQVINEAIEKKQTSIAKTTVKSSALPTNKLEKVDGAVDNGSPKPAKSLRATQILVAGRHNRTNQQGETVNQILQSKAIDIRMPSKIVSDKEVIKGKVRPLGDVSDMMLGGNAKTQNDFNNSDKLVLSESVFKGEVESKGRLGATEVYVSAAPLIGWEAFETYLLENNRLINETPTGQIVQLSFTIRRNGNPNHIKVIKSIDKVADNEAIRLLKAGGKWTYSSGSVNKATVTVLF